ncbi:MAG: hypothetical protein EBX41_01485 [Chitinophagia bacterium]|nr:hypothetical protein [Chitinophagia bacterium]
MLDDNGKFQGYDIVIGNPPYIDYRLIDHAIVANNSYPINKQTNRPNLYQYFIELADCLLNDGGIFCFINPNQFLSTDNGLPLRRFLLNNRTINFITDVSYLSVFKEASTYTVIWMYQKSSSNITHNNISVNRCYNLENLYDTSFVVAQSKLLNTEENIIPINHEYFILNKIEQGKKTLGAIAKLKWGTSKAGYGQLKINAETFNNLPNSQKKLYKPILQTADTKKYYVDWQAEYIPVNIYSNSIRKEFEKPKIVIGRLTKQIQACIDTENRYVGKSILITDAAIDLKLLLAIINSTFANRWYYLKFETTHMQGGYLRFDIPYIEMLPIPVIPKSDEKILIELVDKITALKKNNPQANVEKYEKNIDLIIYKLYHLTAEDIKIIAPHTDVVL